MKLRFVLIALVCLFTISSQARTPLPLPRFVSLKSNKINLRTGPGVRYPVEWVYTKKTLPVEITEEYDTWRKIKDYTGREGWVHQQMVTGKRYVIVKSETIMLRAAFEDAIPVARVEKNAIGKLKMCPQNIKYCAINFGEYEGWIPKEKLWGVYPHEIID